MKRRFITILMWLILLVLADELNAFAYEYLYYPIVDPIRDELQYGDVAPDILLLFVNLTTFLIAGAIIAWRMNGHLLAMAAGMGLGSIWLSLQIAIGFPWFQLMPSHPSVYDHILAFLGSACAPLAAGFGAYIVICRKASATVGNNAI